LSALDAGNRLVHAKTQLDRWSRRRSCPIGCCGVVCSSLGRGDERRRGEHRAGEYHSGPARKLFPLRTENALGDDLIRLLRGGKTRQTDDSNQQHPSWQRHSESLSGGHWTGRDPGSGIRLARYGSGGCAGGHCGFVMYRHILQPLKKERPKHWGGSLGEPVKSPATAEDGGETLRECQGLSSAAVRLGGLPLRLLVLRRGLPLLLIQLL